MRSRRLREAATARAAGRGRLRRPPARNAGAGENSVGRREALGNSRVAEAAGHSRTEGRKVNPCGLGVPAPRFLTIPSCRSPARAAYWPGCTVSCRFARRRRGKSAPGGRGRACLERPSSLWAAAPTATREAGPRAARFPRPSGPGRTISYLQSALPYPTLYEKPRKKHALGPKTGNQACLQVVAVLHQTSSRLRKTDAGVGRLPGSRT